MKILLSPIIKGDGDVLRRSFLDFLFIERIDNGLLLYIHFLYMLVDKAGLFLVSGCSLYLFPDAEGILHAVGKVSGFKGFHRIEVHDVCYTRLEVLYLLFVFDFLTENGLFLFIQLGKLLQLRFLGYFAFDEGINDA